ncbi:glycosyltransferase [Escherichia coli O28ac]|uniref:Glycosyl transferase, group 2 family protein n=6 Tax=Enterobacteriaceae TaxID=543 RepID=B5L457_ECOLX|nr:MULTISPECIES: glycosyltransferase family 2 protein [Enterobacteriaceae]EFY9877827.1 glycosyltransferase [Shigella dysenteriae]EHD3368195.1 glycosyltransferase [Escherichia coli O28ac]EHD3466973.1 glycosyltransferase [Escherichia coli O124]ACD37141.1 WfeT [Escherichia coli]ACD37149.1 WfeT [Escherichia coli]
MNKEVIAVIVTYNRKALLLKVIDAVINQSYPLKKILIIDNNSTDGTEMFISNRLSDVVKYKNTGDNLGGAGGFYRGFIEAEKYGYDYLWLMDDDFMPTVNCLEILISNSPDGIVQPVRYNLDETCAELSPLTYDLSNPFKLNPKGTPLKNYLNTIGNKSAKVDIEAIPFEGPLISRKVVEKIGYPEPKFFIFCDDIEYAIKAKRKGIPIQCNLKAKAYRLLVNNQGNDLLSWKGYFMLRNLFYLHKTYGTNFLVRQKPIVLGLGYALSCVLKCNFSQLPVIWRAFWDSSTLRNTEKFRPEMRSK